MAPDALDRSQSEVLDFSGPLLRFLLTSWKLKLEQVHPFDTLHEHSNHVTTFLIKKIQINYQTVLRPVERFLQKVFEVIATLSHSKPLIRIDEIQCVDRLWSTL